MSIANRVPVTSGESARMRLWPLPPPHHYRHMLAALALLPTVPCSRYAALGSATALFSPQHHYTRA